MSKKTSSKIWDNKFVWAILAVLSSVVLWVYVTATQGDLIEEVYNGVQVVYNGAETLREKSGLIITDPNVSSVSVTLEGTRSEIANLTSDMMTAVINVSEEKTEGRQSAAPTITFAPGTGISTIVNVSSTPQTVYYTVVREEYATISLRAELTGSIAEGFTQRPVVFDPEAIIINGPKSEISKVAYALVVIDRQDVDRTLSFDSTYVLMDADGNEVPIGNMRLSHETVNVTLPVLATKEVPITIDTVDGAGATSENIRINCEPSSITIAGDAEVLAGINSISVGTVDLASFPQTYEETLTIVLANDVINVTGVTEAKVTIQIMGLETRKFTVTNISVINVTQGYSSDVLTESVEVTLRGSAEVLDEIMANNIRIVADATGLGTAASEFELAAKVYVDGFTGVGAVKPPTGDYKIFVRIR